ncbi:hypothetical protein LOTGIDRAFT_234941 [Lottia gigantea]|uniref:Uncharacterized protein n=1 Tax=Lottia gigantea TaxID=225164 RepID=V3ZYH5_LOTGI|nr:hypothetical protein LOTGIDRAFT_234941 [Lottia gigantea]ESO87695.1 hypothetical protein LOTGIDRAFT_234941 [Lottia gigantea]
MVQKLMLGFTDSFDFYFETHKWWLLRCLYIQQEILDDRSPTLCKSILELVALVNQNDELFKDDRFREASIQWNIEAGYFCHLYFEYEKGREYFEKAKNLSHLDINISGALGKRTRYQEDDKAQLVLQVKRSNVQDEQTLIKDIPLPKNISLDDDTVLNKIAFTDEMEKHSVQLSPLDQAVVLACMEGHRRSLAQERLTDEEVLTYILCMLDQLCNWNVGVACLILRSKLEKGSSRRVERSMKQMEELVNIVTQPEPANIDRSYLFYSCHTPSVWKVKKELGTMLLSLGCISAAKDLYESLEMWDEAITCYQIMKKTDQAEVIIREQLKKKETPNLYCFLGDVTHDMNHYQKAWELSNERSSRAMRCMGYLYFGKKDNKAALRCFEKSLEINSLQIPVWFTYGCVALTTDQYEKAVKAFKRCVNIDSDNFEAWNNLGTAYIKLKDKPKAFLTMKEAIKYNFESWQLWENCLLIGVDCGEFEDVVNAYNRLLDLKSKWVDEQILSILVRAIEEDLTDSKGLPVRRFKPKIQQLFTRITSQTTGNGEIWRLFAKLILLDNKPENIDQGLEYLQKSHRCVTQTSNWEKDEKKCQEVSDQAIELAKLYIQCADKLPDRTQKLQNLSSAKFMLKGVITKIKQHHQDPITQSLPQSIDELCKSLDDQFKDLLERIDQLKNC